MIVFKCPNPECGKSFKVQDELAGKKARCQACGTSFQVPDQNRTGDFKPAGQMPPKLEKLTISPESVGVKPSLQPRNRPSEIPPPSPEPPKASNGDHQALAEPGPPDNGTAGVTGKKLRGHLGRLAADEEAIRTFLADFPAIKVMETEGDPPHLYRIEYRIKGLAPGRDGQPIYRNRHLMEIQLPRDYPREKPFCKMLTPVFHPNIDPTYICYTDHWAPAERLLDVIVRIGEMIAYQSWNIKSPRDGEAAMWADLNRHIFPLDRRDFHPGE